MVKYEGRVFRPPSEARSLIIQATIGCSHNKCSFCSMYNDKIFRARSLDEIKNDLYVARSLYSHVKRIFLADGDALVLSFEKLKPILEEIQRLFPECDRVGIYGTSKSILSKSVEELIALKKLGLGIIYLGLESGNEEILLDINKGETGENIIQSGKMVKDSGILLSVTAISGLGGKSKLKDHSIDTAKAFSQMKPDYIGFLSLMIDDSTIIGQKVYNEEFLLLEPYELVTEMLLFLQNIDSEGTVFRSNHASNYFSLYGDLNKDIPRMIEQLEEILISGHFKQENSRRL